MNDIDHIRNVIALYCREADSGNFRAWSELFSSNGALFVNEHCMGKGAAELFGWIKDKPLPVGDHFMSNLCLNVEEIKADGSSTFIFIDDTLVISAKGYYEFTLRKVSGVWKIDKWMIMTPASK